jgi:hypothetical protein
MTREVLERIPDLQDLLEALKTAGEADIVWGVFGGNPADYFRLKKQWMKPGSKDTISVVVDAFVRKELKSATETFKKAKVAYPLLVPIYDKFKTVDVLPANEIMELPADKVLRFLAKENEDDDVVVPSSPAMALVLRYSVENKSPPLEVVRKALGKK